MPVWLATHAAASTDPEVAEAWQRSGAIGYQTQLAMARTIRPAHVKPGLSHTQTADVLWTLGSPETYDLLVLQRGWSTAPVRRLARRYPGRKPPAGRRR